MHLICICSLIEQVPREQRSIFQSIVKLAIDLFTSVKLLLPNTKIRFKLTQARPDYYMLVDNPLREQAP